MIYTGLTHHEKAARMFPLAPLHVAVGQYLKWVCAKAYLRTRKETK